jgi:hypothetical protein
MMRNAPLMRSNIALSVGPCSNGALVISPRSVNARQASGENRSRITEAADCAAPTRYGSAPTRSRCCSAAKATSAGLAFGRSVGTACQAPSNAQICSLTAMPVSLLSVARLSRARTSRSVASARST